MIAAIQPRASASRNSTGKKSMKPGVRAPRRRRHSTHGGATATAKKQMARVLPTYDHSRIAVVTGAAARPPHGPAAADAAKEGHIGAQKKVYKRFASTSLPAQCPEAAFRKSSFFTAPAAFFSVPYRSFCEWSITAAHRTAR